jgi:hypothetical protein
MMLDMTLLFKSEDIDNDNNIMFSVKKREEFIDGEGNGYWE